MLVTSVNYLVFIGLCLLVFVLFPLKYRWISLLIASVIFYLLNGMKLAWLLLISTIITWIAAKLIDNVYGCESDDIKINDDKAVIKKIKQKSRQKARWVLFITLGINMFILCSFKIANYLTIKYPNKLFMTVILPLGISYYTFSIVGYLLDIYWKRYKAEKNYFRFLLFAIYFPHILQGPISRYDKLGNELKKELNTSYDKITQGLQLILWGFFKKLVVADRLSVFVTNVFASTSEQGVFYLIGLFFDVFYIYADFSGYMDIMRGTSELFGIELERNFSNPFLSKSVTEFWRRWHMSLGSWFRDYVYYPIYNSKIIKKIRKKGFKSKIPILYNTVSVAIPVMVTWILTGLWHGTGAGYLAWGIYYGTLITLSVVFTPYINKLLIKLKINTTCFSYRLCQIIKVFCIFAGGRLLTKGGNLKKVFLYILSACNDTGIFRIGTGQVYNYGLDSTNLMFATLGIIMICIVGVLQSKCCVREKLSNQNLAFRWMLFISGIVIVLLFGVRPNPMSLGGFEYQNF